jgi:hypothetical protein
MFLPNVLQSELAERFSATPEVVYRRRGRELGGRSPPTWPWFALAAAVLALPVALQRRWGRGRGLVVAVAGALLGLLGAALWFLAGLSSVPELRWNEQLLVFVPFDALLVVLRERGRAVYARFRLAELAAVSACAALGWLRQPLFAQALVPALTFLLIAVTTRAVPRRPAARARQA